MSIATPQIYLQAPVSGRQATITWEAQSGLTYVVFAKGFWNNQMHDDFVEAAQADASSFTFTGCRVNGLIKVYIKAFDGITMGAASNLVTIVNEPIKPVIRALYSTTYLLNNRLTCDLQLEILSEGASSCSLFCNDGFIEELTNTKDKFDFIHTIEPGTYHYRAVTKSAETNLSDAAEAVISIFAQEELNSVVATETTADSIHIQWIPIPGDSAYAIYVDDEFYESTTNFSSIITRLKPNTGYSVQVIAHLKTNNLIQKFVYSPVSFTTRINAPQALATTMGTNTATLSFAAVDGAEGYVVYLNNKKIAQTADNYFFFDNLLPITQYSFACSAFKDGYETNVSFISGTTGIQAPDTIQFENITSSSAKLLWTPVEGATGYNIYILKGDYEFLVTTLEPCFTHAALIPNTTYHFSVSALYENIESKKSAIYDVTTSVISPVTPKNLSVINTIPGSVFLSWDGVYDYEKEVNYNLYVDGVLYATTSALEYSISGLQRNQRYQFSVAAQNISGESEQANPVEIITTPQLAVPININVEQNEQALYISWDSIFGATQYLVNINSVEFVCDSALFVYPDILPSTEYKIMVKAKNDLGSSYFSSPLAITSAAGLATDSVLAVVSDTGSYGFSVSWGAYPDAYGYRVFVDTEKFDTQNTSITIKNRSPNTTYDVSIAALTGNGVSNITTVSAKTKLPPPEDFYMHSHSSHRVDFSWGHVVGAISYRLVMIEQVFVGNILESETEEVVVTTKDNFCSVSSLLPAANYKFAIYSVEKSGELSDRSDLLSVDTALAVASVPQGLVSSQVETDRLQVRWDPVGLATSYNVYLDGSFISSVAAPICYINVANLSPGSAYQIQISSVYEGHESALSVPLSVITKPLAPANITIIRNSAGIKLSWDKVTSAVAYRLYYKDNYHDTNYSGTGVHVGLPGVNRASPALISSADYFAENTTKLAAYLYNFNPNTPYWLGISAINSNGIESAVTKYGKNFTWTDSSTTKFVDINQLPVASFTINQITGAVIIQWKAAVE